MAAQHDVPTSGNAREQNLRRLQEGAFDVLVIGGGINGAAVARDAAMRGLRVALVEKADFGSGTSSKSSKLIHGGIRYLQQGDFRLVRVACRERDLLRRRLAPHLVQPLEFLFPVYRGDPVGFFTLGLGMWVYDALAIFRNIRAHRMLGPKRALAAEPELRSEGLRGVAVYYDCFTDDARLTLETILGAQEEGAVVTNYLTVTAFEKEGNRIAGAQLQDRFGGPPISVRARCVVNTTGPWADYIRRLDDPAANPCLRLTKGVHIIVPRARLGTLQAAVVMLSPRDKRVLFAIPWDQHALIGTTDTDFEGLPDSVKPDDSDFEYLLEAANWFFPRARLEVTDIVGSYAGLRPLVAEEGKHPSKVSREEEIFESPSGLITLGGGKLTTHRLVAEQIVDLIEKRIGISPVRERKSYTTGTKPLPGGRAQDPQAVAREIISRNGYGLSDDQVSHLVGRYGSRIEEVLGLLAGRLDLRQLLVPGMPDIWAEAEFAVRSEMAQEPEDILIRRTHVGLKDPEEAKQVTELVREKLSGA